MHVIIYEVRMHVIIYIVFVASIILDLATTAVCFQLNKGVETNPLHRLIGFWSLPTVLFIDSFFLLAVEWLRKYIRWSPITLFMLIAASVRAGIINIQLMFK